MISEELLVHICYFYCALKRLSYQQVYIYIYNKHTYNKQLALHELQSESHLIREGTSLFMK